jgi:hypothetical protein
MPTTKSQQLFLVSIIPFLMQTKYSQVNKAITIIKRIDKYILQYNSTFSGKKKGRVLLRPLEHFKSAGMKRRSFPQLFGNHRLRPSPLRE